MRMGGLHDGSVCARRPVAWPWRFSRRSLPTIFESRWPSWKSASGIAAGTLAARFFGPDSLGANVDWLRFLASTGAVVLTFLAGAELEPAVLRAKWKEVTVVGLVGFAAPFLGCAALARYALGWDAQASWLAGVALSTTSMAVVYAVMLETGFNKTDFGKGILGRLLHQRPRARSSPWG